MHRSGPRCQAPRGTITRATPQHRAVKPVVRRSGADRPCGPPGRRRHAQRGVATSVARAVRGERAARRPRPPGERREGARTDGTPTCSCARARRWLCSCLPPPVRPRHYLRLPPCGRRQTMPHLRRCPKSGCRDFVTSLALPRRRSAGAAHTPRSRSGARACTRLAHALKRRGATRTERRDQRGCHQATRSRHSAHNLAPGRSSTDRPGRPGAARSSLSTRSC